MNQTEYHPLIDTLRLYAGWLFACLFIIYALGSYPLLNDASWTIGLLTEWINSPLILQVFFTTFLFLLLSSVHRAMNRGLWKGVLLTIAGFLLLVVFRANA